MRPNPTIPMVLPRSSVPSNRLRSHSPRRIASAAHGMWRAWASSRPMACSAALTVLAPGADGGLLQGSVPRADGPARLFQRPDDLLGALAFGHLEARHGPAAAPFPRQVGDAVLLAPLLHAAAHRVVPTPAPLDAALALD